MVTIIRRTPDSEIERLRAQAKREFHEYAYRTGRTHDQVSRWVEERARNAHPDVADYLRYLYGQWTIDDAAPYDLRG